MDLRPQGQDIIRTWLFSTVVRCAPRARRRCRGRTRRSAAGSSTPTARRCRKSKGNVVTPMDLLEEHGSDAVRYWAASARLGTDAAFEVGQMKIGRRLAIKVLNASQVRAVVRRAPTSRGRARPARWSPSRSTARCWPAWPTSSSEATAALEAYDHTRALELTETFFWTFCDDYLELVKDRAYGARRRRGDAGTASARAALGHRARRAAAPVRARCCRSPPRRSGRGGARARCTARRGRSPSRCARPPATPTRPARAPPARRSPRCAR